MSRHQTGYDSRISTVTFAVACTGPPRDATAFAGNGSTRAGNSGAIRRDDDCFV